MGQLPRVALTAIPADLTAGRSAGCYLAQVRDDPDATTFAVAALYATTEVAPDDEANWFRCERNSFFTFRVGAEIQATWARRLGDNPAVLAIARTGP